MDTKRSQEANKSFGWQVMATIEVHHRVRFQRLRMRFRQFDFCLMYRPFII